MNAAWRHHVGRTVSSGERVPWAEFIHPHDRHAALGELRSAILSGDQAEFEFRLFDGRASGRWFRFSLQALEGPGATAWLCVGTDIHKLRDAIVELEHRASIQTDMLNISVDCIKLIELDGTLIHLNRAGCHALGVPENSSFGMHWLPLLPQDVWEAGEQALVLARSGKFSRFPGRSTLPGKKIQHWDNMLTPVMGADGNPRAILCVSREVTAEREALEALKNSEERMSVAVRVGGLGIWDYDIQRDTLHCDDTWYRIMGRDPAFPIRSISEFRSFIHPEDVDRATEVTRSVAELTASKQDYAVVFRIVRPNGEIRWVRSAAGLIDIAGIVVRAVGFVVDITDAWRGELALRDANRILEEEKALLEKQARNLLDLSLEHERARDAAFRASHEKSRFLAGMSHEFRTPLNAIIGFADVMRQETFGPISPPRYREYQDMIHQSGTLLLSLINDLLDISKIEAGKMELKKEEIECTSLLRGVIGIMSSAASAKEIALAADLEDDQIIIWADERAIKQMLMNLISNAIKFTNRQGRVTVAACRMPSGVLLEVLDSGIGMTPEEVQMALEPYGQIPSDVSAGAPGTGLGVPLVKALAELHGGSLKIESEKGQWTKVTVQLPSRIAVAA
jgi:signal transduction histidine kinase